MGGNPDHTARKAADNAREDPFPMGRPIAGSTFSPGTDTKDRSALSGAS
ncbi:MAG: hypothetical protein V4710_21810 [Verrucomicrobiota bacterium]